MNPVSIKIQSFSSRFKTTYCPFNRVIKKVTEIKKKTQRKYGVLCIHVRYV